MSTNMTPLALKKLLTETHPDLLPVSPLLLQRIIKQHYLQTQGQRIRLPHREFFAIDKAQLLKIVSASELGISAAELPEALLLIQLPNEATLLEQSVEDVLFGMWRLIFQARVHGTLEQARQEGRLTEIEIQKQIAQIGRGAYAEIRTILVQEDFLFPEPTLTEEYITFAAYFLQLMQFAPPLVSRAFPSIDIPEHVQDMLMPHQTLQQLLEQSRPEGASTLESKLTKTIELFEETPQRNVSPDQEEKVLAVECPPAIKAFLDKGNYVRATLAARKYIPGLEAQNISEDSDGPDIFDHIYRRMGLALHDAMGEKSPGAALWQQALLPLTEHMRFGFASAAGRLLYELQKLCQEQKRELYKIDLVDWAVSLGQRPLKRDFSNLREVLYCRYLRHALKMLAQLQLNHWQHEQLKACLQEALEISEHRLRERFRPAFIALFEKIELSSHHLPEEVAQQKLVEELLDKIVNKGFFSMSELRDGIARSNLKIQDLRSPVELATGDTLLLADRILHTDYPGIYRRGEIYLRGLQRASSLFFGNVIGRNLSLWLLLPLIASFVTLEGLQHLLNLFAPKLLGHPLKLLNNTSFIALSLFYMGVINNALVRKYTIACLSGFWRTLRFLFVGLPKIIAKLPLLIAFRKTSVYYAAAEYVAKPAFWTLLMMTPALFFPIAWKSWGISAVLLFVVLSVFLNSPLGRSAHEFGIDHLVRLWHRIRYKILPGLIRWIIDLFKAILQGMDAVIYRVDEWLRFRTEENPVSVAFKAIFGVIWFLLTYLVRVYITLLVEPQVNPIKHFPVVTVSHKIILPMTKPLTLFLAAVLQPFLGTILAATLAGVTVVLLPGVFGFLAWELKENWRLYAANRSPTLQPIIVGAHGETIVRLLRPGFHSGTIPKLYTKFRQYERRLVDQGLAASKHQHQKELHHIKEDLQRFVQREFLALLTQSEAWNHPLHMGSIQISTNHIQLQIKPDTSPQSPIVIHLEERAHWLLASVELGDWLEGLPAHEQQAFLVALAGLYKRSGVQMVHEEITALLGKDAQYDVTEDGLMVWPEGDYKHGFVHNISDEALLQPVALGEKGSTYPPALPTNALLFSQRPLLWDRWVAYWDAPATDNAIVSDFRDILPTPSASEAEPTYLEGRWS